MVKCDNPVCPGFGIDFVEMTANNGSCGICGKTPDTRQADHKAHELNCGHPCDGDCTARIYAACAKADEARQTVEEVE